MKRTKSVAIPVIAAGLAALIAGCPGTGLDLVKKPGAPRNTLPPLDEAAAETLDRLFRSNGGKAIGSADGSVGTNMVAQPKTGVVTGSECVVTSPFRTTLTSEEVAAINPNAGVLFPGSLVNLEDVESGILTGANLPNGSLARRGLTLTITDIATKDSPDGGVVSVSRVVDLPTFESTEQARHELLGRNFRPISNFSYTENEFYTAEQAFMSVGVDAHWLSGSVKASFSRSTATYKTGLLLSFRQRYYTISISPPGRPSDFFTSAASLADLKARFAGISVGYVSSVSYGRWVLLSAESAHSSVELSAALNVAVSLSATGGGNLNANASESKVLSESKLQLLVIGGDQNLVLPISATNLVQKLKELLGTPAGENAVRFGAPLSFRVNYLANNKLKRLQSATEFSKEERHPYVIQDFAVDFHTNDDDKDDDTAVDVYIWDFDHPLLAGSDHSHARWDNNSDHTISIPGAIPVGAIAGKYLRLCISPQGNDTWKFNVTLRGSSGYRTSMNGCSQDQNNRCGMIPLPPAGAPCP